jgi:hypothetical protein
VLLDQNISTIVSTLISFRSGLLVEESGVLSASLSKTQNTTSKK